jgi:hypothetical protein
MFIATGTDSTGNVKIVLRAKRDMVMYELSDGRAYFFTGPQLSVLQVSIDKEKNNEIILVGGRNQHDRFPIGTFTALGGAIYDFEYEKLVPDTNITMSAFEKMQKEAADMKKEIERLKTTPITQTIVKSVKKQRVKADKQEVDLLTVNQI